MQLLQELERKLATLPQAEQEEWVARFLEELAAETDNTGDIVLNDGHWIGGQKPTQAQVNAAIERLVRFREGKTLGNDTTLKDLIDEGRRF